MESASRVRNRQPWLEVLAQDLRYGLRTLRRSPGFTAAALLTLALGIGANTAVFSVVNAVLLRPLPYREPEALVQLVRSYQTGPAAGQDGRRYLFFRDHLRSVEALAAYRGAGSVNMVRGDRAEFVSISQVSKEYFAVFGIQPALGQPFGAEHDVTGGPAVAILSHALWQRSFGASAGVIGSTIVVADKPLTVIGVMPESFEATSPADVFVPLRPGLSVQAAASTMRWPAGCGRAYRSRRRMPTSPPRGTRSAQSSRRSSARTNCRPASFHCRRASPARSSRRCS